MSAPCGKAEGLSKSVLEEVLEASRRIENEVAAELNQAENPRKGA